MTGNRFGGRAPPSANQQMASHLDPDSRRRGASTDARER